MADTCLRAMWCPVSRRRESHLGFRTELENLAGDDKGKGTSGSSARPKVPMRQSGADCLVCSSPPCPAPNRVLGVGRSKRTKVGNSWRAPRSRICEYLVESSRFLNVTIVNAMTGEGRFRAVADREEGADRVEVPGEILAPIAGTDQCQVAGDQFVAHCHRKGNSVVS
jgi:hypothetical protein